MTIKQLLFISQIRSVLVIAGSSIGVLLINRAVLADTPGPPVFQELADILSLRRIIFYLTFIAFVAFFSIINSILNRQMMKKITNPLETLNNGVKQVQENNFAYRIEYDNNDEFHPVCEAFNDMAAKLENSTIQQKKDEANRRELIAGISHDLRTPLTSIIGCIEGIETAVASTPEMKKQYHTFIKNEAGNMKHIIEQLFLFSKLDMDEFPLNMLNIDISLAISEIIEDSLTGYESRGLSVHLSEMPKDIIVSIDVRLLRNVIINILENSVKYKSKERGKMEISAKVNNNYILLSFTDDGPGVEPAILPKLLDVFYRADLSRSGLGSGLGLAISAKIIQSRGGNIQAELSQAGGLAIIVRRPTWHGDNK
jgi:signal transduction histidine kinase